MTPIRLLAAGALLATALASPAAAHGEVESTDPAPDAVVARPPRSVSITFSEPPTQQAVLTVRDGCRRKVGQGVEVVDATATVRVAIGQPGKWRVGYDVISATDGHETDGGYTFTVQGTKDCTPDEPSATPDAGPTRAAPGDDEEDSGSSAPIVPIGLGAVALIVVALIVRRSGSA